MPTVDTILLPIQILLLAEKATEKLYRTHREGISAESNQSLGSVFVKLKQIFGNINIKNIMIIIKNLVSKIKNEKDNFTKFTYIVEAIMELFG